MSTTFFRLAVLGAGLWLIDAAGGASATSTAPRIVQVSPAAVGPAAQTIREPAPTGLITEPAPPPPSRRSEFIPITLPAHEQPPVVSALPVLPAQPEFSGQEAIATNQGSGARNQEPEAISHPSDGNLPSTQYSVLSTPYSAPATERANSVPQIMPQTPSPEPPPSSAQFAIRTIPNPKSQIPNPPSPAMQAVVQRAMQKADQASAMAQRGMLYSSRAELIQSLQMIAQALDIQSASSDHSQSLAAALTALDEARDFALQSFSPGETASVSDLAESHRSQVLDPASASATGSPVVAQQRYFAFAQNRLIAAAGRVPAASQILYRLGRLQTALAAHDVDPLALHAPQAIVFHQAAMATDGGNWLAANELGVLYARYGQLPAAKQLFLASVTMHPHAAGWQNLVAVHRRLGETNLADRADRERQLLAAKTSANAGESEMVRWVDPQTFAAAGGGDVQWPATVASKPTTAAASSKARR